MSLLRYGPSDALGVGFYLIIVLPCLTGILICLAGLFGKEKRVFFLLQLLLALLGLVLFLLISYVSYCLFFCGASASGPWVLKGDRVFGPGFWLILGGLLMLLGVSFAQYQLFRRARPVTVSGAAPP